MTTPNTKIDLEDIKPQQVPWLWGWWAPQSMKEKENTELQTTGASLEEEGLVLAVAS